MLTRVIWVAVFAACLFGITVVSAQTQGDVERARDTQMQADFAFVDKIGSRTAYQAFIDTYRTGDLVETARQRMDGLSDQPKRDGEPVRKRIRM